jgi:hypothetical protein
MKTLSKFLVLLAALMFAAGSSLRAQYNPPPPPDQQDTGAPMDQGQDQQAPPPGDQNALPPGDDQGAPPPDQGDQGGAAPDDSSGNADFQTFYNDLSSQGTWVQTDNYGYAWQPNVQDPNWAPYQNGHWVYTSEGWTWIADDSEPWGWATYHYGRWVNIDGEGWVWVPGYTWAPAWVSWRYGGGYCGWAPLPPDTFVGIDFGGVGFGFHIGGDCDTAYGIGPGYYNFLPVAYLGSRDYHRYYRNRNDNFAIIGNTRNVTNIVVNNQRGSARFGRVSVGGPTLATVNALSRTPVQRVQLTRTNQVGSASLSGNRLAVFAPHVTAAAAGTTFRPSSVGRTLSNVQVNRGTSISQPLQVNSQLRGTAATSAQVRAAQTAQAHLPASAHIATASVRPTQGLSRPLTSYRPHTDARTGTTVRPATAGVNHTQAPGGSADRTFTGEATENRTTGNTVNHEVNNPQVRTPAVQNHVNEPSIPHTEVNANAGAEAEQARREQADRAQADRQQAQRAEVEHAQVEQAPVQRAEVEHAPVEHAPVQVQHAEVEHAPVQSHESVQHAPAPAQHEAPHPSGGGGGKPSDDKNKDNNHH